MTVILAADPNVAGSHALAAVVAVLVGLGVLLVCAVNR